MAQAWQAFSSGIPSNGYNAVDRTFVDLPESIGTPLDSIATDVAAPNSAMSLLKGMGAGLGVPAGSGDADTNESTKLYADPLVTLGEMGDAAASDFGTHSAISLMKGILAVAGI